MEPADPSQNSVNFGTGSLTSAGLSDIAVAKYSATGVPLWSKSFGGWLTDSGNAVAVDAAGNVVVTGQFGNWINFGAGYIQHHGSNDIFIVKLTPSGTTIWGKTFGGSSDDFGAGVAVDASGNVVITGGSSGIVDFGGGNLIGNGMFLAKYSPSGAPLSSQLFANNLSAQGSAVTVDGSGSVVATGSFSSTTIDLGSGPLTNAGGTDILLLHRAL